MQTSNFNKNIVAALLASALTISGAGLVACGGQQNSAASSAGSSSNAEASSSADSSQSTAPASAQSTAEPAAQSAPPAKGSGDPTDQLKMFSEEVYEAYEGVTDSGSSVYYAANRDSSTCMIAFADETGEYVCYVGPLSVDGNTYSITDSDSSAVIAFGVEQNETGTLVIDLGDLGRATVSPTPHEPMFEKIYAIEWSGQEV